MRVAIITAFSQPDFIAAVRLASEFLEWKAQDSVLGVTGLLLQSCKTDPHLKCEKSNRNGREWLLYRSHL